MVRIISTFLILSLVVIHGQIDHAMFGSQKTTAQISEFTSSGIKTVPTSMPAANLMNAVLIKTAMCRSRFLIATWILA
jgi:hypothetical protein